MTQYKLYQLGCIKFPQQFSAHVWKTKIDFAILGVEYERCNKSFNEIRGELATLTKNDKCTVPTLEIDGKEFITDSWLIAEYLEKKYATPQRSLFGGSDQGVVLAKFMETWSNNTLSAELRPMIMPFVYMTLNEPSQDHFLNGKKQGPLPDLMEKYKRNFDPEFISTISTKSIAQLKTLESLLTFNASRGWKFIGGEKPTHADACVWGHYCFSRMNPKLIETVWQSDQVPRVKAWVNEMMESGLVDKEELISLEREIMSP